MADVQLICGRYKSSSWNGQYKSTVNSDKIDYLNNIFITKLGLVERGTNESGEDVINS